MSVELKPKMDTWNTIKTWDLVLPPSRPSAYHLSIIKKVISEYVPNHSQAVAVLGSTPEYRDLLAEMGYEKVFILEKSPEFYKLMSTMRIYSNREELIEGDWLETLPTFKDYFALILSDLTMGNIPYESRSLFYQRLSESLIQNGLFIDKVLTHPCEHIKLATLIDKYSELPVNLLHVNYFSCEFFFCSELLELRNMVDSSLFYATLEKELKSEKLHAFLKQVPKITPSGCSWYYGKNGQKFRKITARP